MHLRFFPKQSGFSLVELLIMVGIISILAAVTVPLFHSYQSKNDLYTSVDQMQQALNRAKLLSANGKNGSSWGVNASSGVLFMGASYAMRDTKYDELYELPLTITATGVTEVVFEQLTGKPSRTGSIIFMSDTGDTSSVNIGNYGVTTIGSQSLQVCYEGLTTTISDSLWPSYKANGATVGACFGPQPYNCNNTGGTITLGMLLLNPTAAGAFKISGNGSLTTTGAIAVNSSDAGGLWITGAGSATAAAFYASGEPGIQDSGGGAFGGHICGDVPVRSDQYATLSAPAMPSTTFSAVDENNGTTVIDPGTYNGGIHATGSARITMNPGVYYLNGGGLRLQNNARVTGNGVFIYNAPLSSSDAIEVLNSAQLTLTAMTTGEYSGIAIFQDRTSNVGINNDGMLNIRGAIYAPSAQFNNASGVNNNVTLFIGDTFEMSGNGDLTMQ